MKKRINSIVLLLVLSMFCTAAVSAQSGDIPLEKTAAVLADTCRIMTDSDFAIVSRTAAREAAETQDEGTEKAGTVIVKRLSGQEVYDLIGKKIAEGGDAYPYFSGISAVTRTQTGNGGMRSEQLEELYAGEELLDSAANYSVALSGDYAAEYESKETLAEYRSETALLGKYLSSYQTGGDSVQQAGTAFSDGPGTGDGAAILHNQTTILLSALSLVAIALAIYLIVWRKKKRQDDGNKSL